MKILFLTMSPITEIHSSGIYFDLMRKFRDEGHDVYTVSPLERRRGMATNISFTDGVHILCVRTPNLQKTHVIEKGLGMLLMSHLFKSAIRKYLKGVKFDVILYTTPPITYTSVIACARKQNPQAMTYLMLKDIFPQNAVDLGIMGKSGLKGLLYRFFRRKEQVLYKVSDFIGCMSPANVDYLLAHNPFLNPDKVELCPNSYEVKDVAQSAEECRDIRRKYGLPEDRLLFLYGGNMGKPQGIPFLLECLKANAGRRDCHFALVGDGTEYGRLDAWIKAEKPANVSLFPRLVKADYDALARSCDAGLVFLDYRFTIPNHPSRLLPFLMNRKPVIAATDRVSDVGPSAEAFGFGYWCPSNDAAAFTAAVDRLLQADRASMGEKGRRFFLEHHTVSHSYNAVMKHVSHV